MYSFPRITLPPAFLAEAKRLNKAPDVLYCLQLLEETGLSCVPGSGFRQREGTFHLRTTILVHSPTLAFVLSVTAKLSNLSSVLFGCVVRQPPEDKFDDIIGRFTSFHKGFMQ